MSRYWLETNSPRFTAEILRGFCDVSLVLTEQFDRFDRAGNLSFPVLRDLVGEMLNKGPLWRLKDLSHHILRDAEGSPPAARLLDWAIGYIFHETIKLMEDAHQHRYYTPRLQGLMDRCIPQEEAVLADDFFTITREIHADMSQGVARISRLLSHARAFFRLYAPSQAGNRYLARFLHDNEEQVREAFQEQFHPLLKALYSETPERMHLEAALSLLEAGHAERAREAALKAAALAPNRQDVADLLARVDREAERLAAVSA